jgi:mannose-1-phosphate guanylyltransferase
MATGREKRLQAIDKIIPVILCGGQGARLRDVSNGDFPKQFHYDEGGKSLLSLTLQRVLAPEIFAAPMLFGNVHYQAAIEAAVNETQLRSGVAICPDIILEPFRRNTLAPVVLGAFYAHRRNISQILIMPSDHIIEDTAAFENDVSSASILADTHQHIVYFGVSPDSASPEYGYIQSDQAGVVEFHEKPDSKIAASYIAQGALWNSGIFLIPVEVFLRDLRARASEIYALGQSFDFQDKVLDAELFHHFPDITFDRFYCEKTSAGRVLRASFDWCDIGSIEHYRAKGLHKEKELRG